MLTVKDLKKTYDTKGRRVEAIGDVSFSVADGEFVCVVGPSGCGKTTLLRCIAGLLPPTSGEVHVEGKPVTGPPDGLAVVFQEYGRSLFPWLRVADNVDLPLRAAGMPRAKRRELVGEALESVGLADAHNAYPWQLSGGMQQRVAIARARHRRVGLPEPARDHAVVVPDHGRRGPDHRPARRPGPTGHPKRRPVHRAAWPGLRADPESQAGAAMTAQERSEGAPRRTDRGAGSGARNERRARDEERRRQGG